MNEDLQRVSVTAAMMLKAFTTDGIFGFDVNDFKKMLAADPTAFELHIGSFSNLVVVWVGKQSREEIQQWITQTATTEIEMVVPVANPDSSIN